MINNKTIANLTFWWGKNNNIYLYTQISILKKENINKLSKVMSRSNKLLYSILIYKILLNANKLNLKNLLHIKIWENPVGLVVKILFNLL